MPSVAELVLLIKGKDEASAEIKATKGALQEFGGTAVRAGAAVSGAGVALEAFARTQQKSNIAVGQNAALIGVSETEYRNLATSLSDAGFPLEDVNELIKIGAQEGLQGNDQLKDFARFWDDVGDATGLAAGELAKGSTGLRAVGVAAGQEGQALSAFGFITDHTKLGVDEFLALLAKKGKNLHDFGISIDDTAAVLGLMEKELGLTGRAASTEFATALESSDGTMGGLLKTLGLTQEQFGVMRQQVDASSGVIERNSAIDDANKTAVQRLSASYKDFLFTHAPVVRSLSEFAPALVAAGPAIGGFATALHLVGPAAGVASAALRGIGLALLTPPLGIIIALVAVGVAIYIFRDQIMDGFGAVANFVGEAAPKIGSAITGAFSGALEFLRNNWPEIAVLIAGPFAPLVILATDAFGIRTALGNAFIGIAGFIGEQVIRIAKAIQRLPGYLGDLVQSMYNKGIEIGRNFTQGVLNGIGDLAGAIAGKVAGAGGGALGKVTGIFRAHGGPVSAGQPYIVGERGPELFMPNSSGSIVPNGRFAAGGLNLSITGPVTVNNHGQTRDAKHTLADVAFAIAAELRARGVLTPA